jgi:hypothetical protein
MIPKPKRIPSSVAGDLAPKILSDRELENVIGTLGLKKLNPRMSKALKKLGEHLDAQGITHMQAGRVVCNLDCLDDVYEKVMEQFDQISDPELKLDALRLAKDIRAEIRESSKAVEKMVSEKRLGSGGGPIKHQGAAPGQVVGVIVKTEGDVHLSQSEEAKST